MKDLYNDFLEIDEAEAHEWRIQTLNFIMRAQARDRPQFWGSNISWMNEQVKNFQPKYCSKLASNFINGPARTLLEPSSPKDQRHQDLVDVIQAAGWYGSVLWRQCETLKIQSFEDLKGKKFSSKSAEMEWDRIHGLDPGENAMDGYDIMMVVQPGLVAVSKEDGEMMPRERVWSKAIVF